MMKKTSTHAAQGFTLIELMIVVAIIAIIASIALPSYRESVARGRRADARSVLLENVQWMERNFTLTNKYDKDGAGTTIASPTVAAPLSGSSPKEGTDKYYTITLSTLTAATFTFTATPINGMSGDKCGNLTITHTGAKGQSGTGATIDQCWNK